VDLALEEADLRAPRLYQHEPRLVEQLPDGVMGEEPHVGLVEEPLGRVVEASLQQGETHGAVGDVGQRRHDVALRYQPVAHPPQHLQGIVHVLEDVTEDSHLEVLPVEDGFQIEALGVTDDDVLAEFLGQACELGIELYTDDAAGAIAERAADVSRRAPELEDALVGAHHVHRKRMAVVAVAEIDDPFVLHTGTPETTP
jgi:hypothetical protein